MPGSGSGSGSSSVLLAATIGISEAQAVASTRDDMIEHILTTMTDLFALPRAVAVCFLHLYEVFQCKMKILQCKMMILGRAGSGLRCDPSATTHRAAPSRGRQWAQ